MDAKADDVVYLVAMRTRAPNRGQAVQEVMRVLDLARADEDTGYVAIVAANPLAEYTSTDHRRLCELGFTWDDANQIMPVAVESR